jgi:hypothetical protein
MTKSIAFENSLLSLIFENDDTVEPLANLGDGNGIGASAGDGNIYVSLHTADPGDSGDASTSETAYTPYARVAVSRATGWTVTGSSCSPTADIDFAECTASPGGPLTHFALSSGQGTSDVLLYSGDLTPDITMATGVIPRIKTTSTVVED